jgi:hypothetical protein
MWAFPIMWNLYFEASEIHLSVLFLSSPANDPQGAKTINAPPATVWFTNALREIVFIFKEN